MFQDDPRLLGGGSSCQKSRNGDAGEGPSKRMRPNPPRLDDGPSMNIDDPPVDHSLPTMALPRRRSSGNSEKTTKAPKLSDEKLKRMVQIEAERLTLEICLWFGIKLPSPETQVSDVDAGYKLSPEAPICKLKSKVEVKVEVTKTEHDFEVGKCATVGISEIERQPSLKLQVTKKAGKKNAVPGETAEEARKRLAIVLLRIAGKY